MYMYEHNALGYWSGLALCLTKMRSSQLAHYPATAFISLALLFTFSVFFSCLFKSNWVIPYIFSVTAFAFFVHPVHFCLFYYLIDF